MTQAKGLAAMADAVTARRVAAVLRPGFADPDPAADRDWRSPRARVGVAA